MAKLKTVCSAKPRNKAFEGRKRSIMKQAKELSVLCDVKVCAIVFGLDGKAETWPNYSSEVISAINMFSANRHCVKDQSEEILAGTRLKNQNSVVNATSCRGEWNKRLDAVEILRKINSKLQAAAKRMDFLKNNAGIELVNHGLFPQSNFCGMTLNCSMPLQFTGPFPDYDCLGYGEICSGSNQLSVEADQSGFAGEVNVGSNTGIVPCNFGSASDADNGLVEEEFGIPDDCWIVEPKEPDLAHDPSSDFRKRASFTELITNDQCGCDEICDEPDFGGELGGAAAAVPCDQFDFMEHIDFDINEVLMALEDFSNPFAAVSSLKGNAIPASNALCVS